MPFVYLLRCADGSLYCGWSTDLGKRLAAHQDGRGGRYTRSRVPVSLGAAWETTTSSEARSLEGRIKRLSAGQKRALVAGEPIEALLGLDRPVEPVRDPPPASS